MNGDKLVPGILLTMVLTCPTFAESSADTTSGSSIFSPPEQATSEVPSFVEDKSNAEKVRKLLLGGKDEIPSFQTIRAIPSLSSKQRKDIQQIYSHAKDQLAPLTEQLKSMREKYGGREKAAQNPEAREAFLQLTGQVRELRKQLWQQVKFELTDKQMQELEAMRHGELKPATFSEPATMQSDIK